MAKSLPLSDCHGRTARSITNRLHFFIHGLALLFLFRYRLSSLAQIISSRDPTVPLLPHLLIFIAEAIFTFIWLLNQPSKWRPVVRTPYPERLPADRSLPAIDVFVCTADPNKEPSLNVMNTVISAMALDYPPDKLHIYVSDDGGSSVTLRAAKQAWDFAKFWIPFCKKHGVINRCPEAYFLEEEDDGHGKVNSSDIKEIQISYEEFKSRVSEIVGETSVPVSKDHPAVVEVIGASNKEEEMPFLAYVAREKRRSHPHHFKAGALNVLFRVSAMITNSPYILVLDCDMYCNDSSSARRAMCFHLDAKLSPKLGFVQFPQIFYNIAQKDIYDGRLRLIWEKWEGLDGIQGPILSGTGFYVKREAIYGSHKFQDDGHVDLVKLNKCFGSSDEFIRSMSRNYRPKHPNNAKVLDDSLQKEIQLLASCSYDKGTKWGTEVGFRYFSVVEDYFTGMNLHCEGWTSVYTDPSRPCFLGTSPISLGEHLIQFTRWYTGLIQIVLSRFNPLLYCPLRMSLWQSICYAELAHTSLHFVAFYVLAIVPQLCLLRGIPLYPEVSSPYFGVFLFIFFSSQLKHAQEVLSTGNSIRVWLVEQRMWMIRSWVSYLYATVEVVLEKFGLKAASFLPTNKAVDDELEKRYRSGVYDFQAAPVLMVPLCSLYMLNVAAFALGIGRILKGNGNMLVQGFIPLFGMALHFPIFEGMVLRKDKGRVSPSVCLTSTLVCGAVLSFGLNV